MLMSNSISETSTVKEDKNDELLTSFISFGDYFKLKNPCDRAYEEVDFEGVLLPFRLLLSKNFSDISWKG